jgi:hypothetical protein
MTAYTWNTPLGLDNMDRNWPPNLYDLGYAAYDVFLWPGNFVLSQVGTHAPGLALKLGIGVDGDAVVLPAIASAVVWSLLVFLGWKTTKSVCAQILYGGRRVKAILVAKFQKTNRRRQLSRPVAIPDVEIDDLDLAILDTGLTLPPGLALTAAELAGQMTKRPAQLQQRLEKLRKYGLVDGALGETDGFDNYRLTRSGAAVVSIWHRQGGVGL